MKTWKIITTITLTILAAALITGTAFALFTPQAQNRATIYTSGMMSGNTYAANGNYPTTTAPPVQTQTPTTTYPNGGYGWGCMGGVWGWNYGAAPTTTTSAITLDSAVQTAQNYVASLNNPDLVVTQVEEITENFYVQVSEKSTGSGAFELLIDKTTGSIGPEMGPNTMWNTKYGVQNGVCGWLLGTPITAPTVTVDQARADAQQYLNTYYAGTSVGDVTGFYGYYTVEILNGNGTTYGMLSVNAYTGQVWFHDWHGAFVQEWMS